jgi:hypothetical protein
MRRRSPKPDRGQLTIDWTATAIAPRPPATEHVSPPEPAVVAQAAEVSELVQVLPWDFQTTFPPVLQDAIDAGVIAEEDAAPDNLAALHVDHAAALLTALTDLESISDARRQGVEPATGRPPRKPAKKSELKARLDREVARLEGWWRTLLDTYEGAFGAEAADAFGKYVRARHAGIEVTTDPRLATVAAVPVLPAPRALRRAVTAGVFGRDEDGPVDPDPDEVEEITTNHAEVVISLVEAFRRVGGSLDAAAAGERVREEVQRYADDFGQAAGDRLLAYCRRQAVLNDSTAFHPVCRP